MNKYMKFYYLNVFVIKILIIVAYLNVFVIKLKLILDKNGKKKGNLIF